LDLLVGIRYAVFGCVTKRLDRAESDRPRRQTIISLDDFS
jgi:hypothetical protein